MTEWTKGNKPVIHRFDTERKAECFRSQVAHGEILSWGRKRGFDTMKINIEISDNEIERMIKSAIQDKVTEWFKEEINKYSSFHRYFEKEYKETIKEMLYEPELKQEIIDKAVKEAALEIKRKGIAKLLDEVKA